MLLNLSLLFDTGLLVLIWLVQLVIYPSFTHYSFENMKTWHRIYTKRMTIVVFPLMLGQLVLGSINMYATTSTVNTIKIILMLIVWVLTFVIFVPLHKAVDITSEYKLKDILQKLVLKNWYRTIVWSIIFMITLAQVLRPYLS